MKGIFLFAFVVGVSAHTIVSKPQPRQNSVHTNHGVNSYGGECGDDKTVRGQYTRGQEIDIEWGRNNHHGGFTQVSVIPLNQCTGGGCKDQREQLDNPANIIWVACYDLHSDVGTPCHAGRNTNGGDDLGLGGDGTNFQQNMCSTKLKIPTYLADGDYVMKTAIFGNGDSFGVRNMPHSSYTNCHNFRISGGAAVTNKPANNGHIDFSKMKDHSIDRINQKTGQNIPNNQCLFSGTISHLGCQAGNGRSPRCTGKVADDSRCGQGSADARRDCIGNRNNEGETQGGDLYNYMIGKPEYHPSYAGTFFRVHHAGGKTSVQRREYGGGSGGGGAKSPTAAPAPTPGGSVNTGTVFNIVWTKSSRAIDVAANNQQNGNNVQMWERHRGGNQKFVWTSCQQLKWVGTNKCLDSSGVDKDGANVHIWDCNCGNPNQKWEYKEQTIRWTAHNKCMDVAGGSNLLGANVQLWSCWNKNPNQLFKFEPTTANMEFAPMLAAMRVKETIDFPWKPDATEMIYDTTVSTTTTVPLIHTIKGSTIKFTDSGTNNPVKLVCEEKFALGDKEGECEDPAEGSPTLTVADDGSSSFTSDTSGTFFFVGNQWPTQTEREAGKGPAMQRLQVIFDDVKPAVAAAEEANKGITEFADAMDSSKITIVADTTAQVGSASRAAGLFLPAVLCLLAFLA